MPNRPLTDEPLALDLVDTHWVEDGHEVDLFDEPDALRAWLREHDLSSPDTEHSTTPSAVVTFRAPLREARAAIRGILENTPGAAARFAAVLDHGRVRLTFGSDGPGESIELDDPTWGPAWHSARAYLQLLDRAGPGRIRHCDGAGCVLWFLDTSRNGTRRWCSMAGCGNRAKAQLHYRRHRGTRGRCA